MSETTNTRVDSLGNTVVTNAKGELHCTSGPAITDIEGNKYWYRYGKRHREDGPAVEYADGSKFWYRDGKRHREDGPAVERSDGVTEWFVNGKRHNLDGPAYSRVLANGSIDYEYYLNGVPMSLEYHCEVRYLFTPSASLVEAVRKAVTRFFRFHIW